MNDIDTSTALTERARTLAVDVVATSRRGLICGAVGASTVAVLAACGGGGSADGGSSDDGAKDDKSSDDGGGSGKALAKESDIPEGGGKVVDDLIVVQPKKGEFVAFSTTCPHKQLPKLQAPKDGTITCAAHGSQFKIDGTLAGGPATKGLTVVKVEAKDGEIFKA